MSSQATAEAAGGDQRQRKYYKTVDDIDKMLDTYQTDARTRANQRLRETFLVESLFTSTLDEVRAPLRIKIQVVLGKAPGCWPALKERADLVLEKALQQDGNLSLVSLVQTVVFAATGPLLFPDDNILQDLFQQRDELNDKEQKHQELALKSCKDAAALINELWIMSKTAGQLEQKDSLLRELRYKLAQIFGTRHHKGGRENQLNFIIPAYETVWRVILRIAIEVLFRQTNRGTFQPVKTTTAADWQMVLEQFHGMEGVDSERLRERTDFGVSVFDIVREGLRLHPPTRHIHREAEDGTIHIADIESMQRNFWPNGTVFDPSRWQESEEEGRETRAYRPFGHGRYQCLASRSFGSTLIGVLTASLVAGLKTRGVRVRAEDEESRDAIHGIKPLNHERSSYKGLYVVKPDGSSNV